VSLKVRVVLFNPEEKFFESMCNLKGESIVATPDPSLSN
jgi:hypothetical protein